MSYADFHGRFVWYDLMTSDTNAAVEFYCRVASWGQEEWNGPMPYTMFTAGGKPFGGVGELSQEAIDAGAPPHWISHIGVTDIESSVKEARSLGARIIKDIELIPTVGKFAIVADPQGAVTSIFTPEKEAPGHEGPPGVGDISWHELATTDFEKAYAYYSLMFGWNRADAMDMGEMGIYQMFRREELLLGGMFNKPPQMPVAAWLYYVLVEDIAAKVEKVKNHGGEVLIGPTEVPGGDLIAQCLDPQGAAFAIHSKKK